MQSKHELVSCPRCNNIFECKSNKITECFCQHIKMKVIKLESLENSYETCLCKKCLEEINAQ